MRKAEFYVPSEAMVEFADALASRKLDNTVAGTTHEGEVVIEVNYERDDTDDVDELEETLAKLRAQLEEEGEEEQEEKDEK